MPTNQALAPSTVPSLSFNLMQVPSERWVDRTIVAVACIPLVYGAYYRMEHFHLGLPRIAAVLNTSILVVTMLVRRPPERITPNPWYCILAFVASYWLVFIIFFLQKGRPVVANWMSASLATLGLAIVLWARLSLGRNIGFVPAQRDLVHTGAYASMCHPLYTGVLYAHTAFVLRAYNPLNLLLRGMGVLWFIPIKSLVGEDFLRHDPQYAAYMQRVRARWIPFVI
jgi:protein-S-isoprenylcysteine O-methyltransferase Ste14